jgi:hypothetical protein
MEDRRAEFQSAYGGLAMTDFFLQPLPGAFSIPLPLGVDLYFRI